MLDVLEAVMESLGIHYLRLDGSTPSSERMDLIDEFNSNPNVTVFLLSTKACGIGINLTAANTVILYDIDFNPHNDNQAEDRAHRVGQTRPVTVYKFILKNTVEQHMLTCANFKLLLDLKVQDREAEKLEPDSNLLKLLQEDLMTWE
jgi:SWI/SNF-related matrix-associated actin-dependent regulator 1 of chromatin subfamily A